ncbi:hypothetical protein Hanom_Chr06g00565721 [Helianthus anomalus]
MASKIGESSSSTQTSSDALYAKWGLVSFNNLIQDYGIRAEWNPVLPSKTGTVFPLKESKITLFSDFFQVLQLSIADHQVLYVGHILELTVFRAFFVLMWKSPFFYLRQKGHRCVLFASSKDKDWKKKFFYIDVGVIPGEMQWREMGPKDKVKDDGPLKDAYVANALYKRLCECPFECMVIPKGALVMAGMSLLWRDIKIYPSFGRDDEGKWSLFLFVDPPRHAALKAADRVIGELEPYVLKIHLEQFLLPAVPADPDAYIS